MNQHMGEKRWGTKEIRIRVSFSVPSWPPFTSFFVMQKLCGFGRMIFDANICKLRREGIVAVMPWGLKYL